MAVYVDQAKWRWRGKMWCHLTADSISELHAFAGRLGLREEWFQFPKTPYPHYDLMESKRAKALKMGAVEKDSRFVVEKCKEIRPVDWKHQRLEYHRDRRGT